MRCKLSDEGKKVFAATPDQQGEVVAEFPGAFRVAWDTGCTCTVDAALIEIITD